VRRSLATAFVAGAVFGLGLVLSQMADPRVVLAFLDITGAFNPALIFVMGGAVAVTAVAFRLVLRRPQPLFEGEFRLPTGRAIDTPLIAGAAIFGLGWGLAGYCPGPALVNLAAGASEAWWFVPAMIAGGWLQRWLERGGTGRLRAQSAAGND
jgi:uncharacterized membrane protein YedE/YeeE